MKKRTRNVIITACVAVVVAAAVLVGVFVGKPMVERQQVEQEFAARQQYLEELHQNTPDSNRLPYEEGVPLSEMDSRSLESYLYGAQALMGTPLDSLDAEAYHITLPVDVNYYSTPDASGEPAYTIPKGTEVRLYDIEEKDPAGAAPYGCVCYPDYEKGWRYGRAFLLMEGASSIKQSADDLRYYYVQTETLKAVLGAYYDKNQEVLSEVSGREEYIDSCVQYIDRQLFSDGYFCSPELERLWDGYVTVAEQSASQEKE
ncbi:MAG TPA: hypothetical protein H9679_05195 [Firmicutes bacterium]|nr:hypothetical protein [Bacillota bacterium]